MKLGVRQEYTVEYLTEILGEFLKITGMNREMLIHRSDRRKTPIQKLYERIDNSRKKLKEYLKKVEICGAKRTSFSKIDRDATFILHKSHLSKLAKDNPAKVAG